jgi:hypothetical protein
MWSPSESGYPTFADIAEMKASGYDVVAIAEAAEFYERGVRAESLCQEIRNAFADVKLGRGLGLREVQSIGEREGESERLACRASDEKDDWQSIPNYVLNELGGMVSLEPEGFRFHLPAYLLAHLCRQYDRNLLFVLTKVDAEGREKFSMLSKDQRSVIRSYLLFMRDNPEEAHDREAITRALDYWH